MKISSNSDLLVHGEETCLSTENRESTSGRTALRPRRPHDPGGSCVIPQAEKARHPKDARHVIGTIFDSDVFRKIQIFR